MKLSPDIVHGTEGMKMEPMITDDDSAWISAVPLASGNTLQVFGGLL